MSDASESESELSLLPLISSSGSLRYSVVLGAAGLVGNVGELVELGELGEGLLGGGERLEVGSRSIDALGGAKFSFINAFVIAGPLAGLAFG